MNQYLGEMLVAIQFLKHRFFIVGFFIHLLFSLNGQNLLSNYSGNWGDEGFHFNVVNVESFDVRKLESPNYISDYLDLPKGSTLTPKFNQNKNSTVVRYIHRMNGYAVLGSEVVARYSDEILIGFNGIIYSPLVSSPNIDSEEAKEIAINASGGEIFNWQVEEEEAMLKLWTEDSLATYDPIPELIYVPKDLDFSNEFSLCYGLEINAIEPLIKKNIYVNAQTGELWATEDLIHVVEVKGSANTKYRGVRSIQTDSTSPTNFRLRESGRGNGIETYNMQKGTSYAAAVDFTDADNYWNN